MSEHTTVGNRNRNGQITIRETQWLSNHRTAKIYILKCEKCGFRYGANGCDIHIRKCPSRQGGKRCSRRDCPAVADGEVGNCRECRADFQDENDVDSASTVSNNRSLPMLKGNTKRRETFVGFDSAWVGNTPGGICWATFVDGRFEKWGEPRCATFDDAAGIIEELHAQSAYTLVALDQQTVVENETGMRPVEKVAASLVSKLKGGVQPANRSKEAMFGDAAPIWKFIERIGATQNPAEARSASDGLHLIEVFPALALPSLELQIWERKRKAAYNPSKKNFSPEDWRMVAKTVQRHAKQLKIAPLAKWAAQMADKDRPAKPDQDRIDAAICLIIALYWRCRNMRDIDMAFIGDTDNGYMVTPVAPETREILQTAAEKKGVPMMDGC